MPKSRAAAVAVVFTVGATLAACSSGGGGSGGGGGGGGGGNTGSKLSGTGAFTFVTGKDNSGIWPILSSNWNKAHPSEKVTVKQQSDQADQQLSDLEQHFQAKDPNYDVVTVDVVWTAEFAAKGWVVPLTGANKLDTSKMLKAPVNAATYNGTLFAAPWASDGGVLYYRTDQVKTPPKTWTELIADCKGKTSPSIQGGKEGCYAGQFAKYEGLTVNAAEAINAAGGQIVKSDGKTPNVATSQAASGLDFLVNGFKQGYIPKEAIGFQETQSLNAFDAGQLMFMRNWPYAYAIAHNTPPNKGSKIASKFAVAPLPGPSGHGASSLGGHSIAISAYSKHQASGLAFVKWLDEPAQQRIILTKGTLAPVIASLYQDKSLYKQFPYLPTLYKSILTAVPRPVTPFYPAVTEAIESNAYAALQGQKSTQQALKDMQAAIKSATGA
jgi:multiple sugar transport system substrate-binding protein